MSNLNPYFLILETLQVQSKYGNVDGRFISHKMARKASGLTGATARAMKLHGKTAAGFFGKARKNEDAEYNLARGIKAKNFGRAERAEGNGDNDLASRYDAIAGEYGKIARKYKPEKK